MLGKYKNNEKRIRRRVHYNGEAGVEVLVAGSKKDRGNERNTVNHTLYQGYGVKNLKISEKRQTLANRNCAKKKRRRKHSTVVYETTDDFGEKTMVSDLTAPRMSYQHIADVSNYLGSPHSGIASISNEKEKTLVKRKDK